MSVTGVTTNAYFPPKDDREEFQKSPWDVTKYANHSYRVEGRKLTWFQAQEECARGGGHLASILSAAQSKELLAMAKRDGFPLWIGLSNQAVSLISAWASFSSGLI